MSDPELHERVYTYYSLAKAGSIFGECQDKYIDIPEDGKVSAIS